MGFITIFIALAIIISMVLLVAGTIISKKYNFMGVFYFFLIFIFKELYSLIAGPIIRNHINAISSNEVPMGMTIGEYVAWLSHWDTLIPKILELIAFSFLVVGLYKLSIRKTS